MATLPRALAATVLIGALGVPALASAHESESIWLVQTSDIDQLREQAAHLDITEREHYSQLWEGVSVKSDPTTARYLESLPTVEAVWESENYELPDVEPERVSEMDFAVDATGVSELPDSLDGNGTRIGIIDTGIDYQHPDLGGCFGPLAPGEDCKVNYGWDFVGDDFDSSDPDTEPQPGPDPNDCNGHGTHVAGISAAHAESDSGVTGVAPAAELGAYRVFGCEGTTSAEVLLQAMERAAADGMDVVNMSIGQAFSWPQYPTAIAAGALVDQGVSVIASIGNSGEFGVFSSSAPGLGADVVGVASIDNPFARADAAIAQPLDQEVGIDTIADAPGLEVGDPTPPLRWHGRGCTDDEAANDVTGMTAMMVRGECPFEEKYERAIADGAEAVVIKNDQPGLFSGTGAPDGDIPMAAISQADGEELRERSEAGDDVTLEATGEKMLVEMPYAGLPSSFTSFGPSPDLAAKPDVAAPGGGIWSTYLTDQDSYASLSGTSMAAPHVAGAAALLLQDQPDSEPQDVKAALLNTANPVSSVAENSTLEPAHRQGTGMIDVPAAVENQVQLSPEAIGLGDTTTDPTEVELEVANRSADDMTYELRHRPAVATAGTVFEPEPRTAPADVEFEEPFVDVPAGQIVTVPASITAPDNLDTGGVYGGYLELHPTDKGHTVITSYVGYVGDYLDIEVMPDEPELAVLDADDDLQDLDAGTTFSASSEELPVLLIHMAHQATMLEMTLEQADGDTSFDLLSSQWVGRSATPEDQLQFPIAELIETAPDDIELTEGEWEIHLRALKALGDDDNPDHWEERVSPSFTVTE